MLINISVVVFSYFLGAIPFGYILFKMKSGGDIRKYGSGNIGATNMLRTGGKTMGILTMILDLGKGSLALIVPKMMGIDAFWLSLCGVMVVIGHIYPVFLLFRGGKGVATAAGVFIVVAPLPFLLSFAVFVSLIALTRFVSLGSIFSSVLMPLFMYLFSFVRPPFPAEILLMAVCIAFFIVIRHSSNIKNLINGKEKKLGNKVVTGGTK